MEVDQRVLPELLVAMLFHKEADIRRSARKRVLAGAPQPIIDRFEGDKTRWAGVSNRSRVVRLVKEMERLGVDGKRFGLGMAVRQLERRSYDLGNFCVALAPLYGADFFEALAHERWSSLSWGAALPDGIDRLRVDRLRLYGPMDLGKLAGSPVEAIDAVRYGGSRAASSSRDRWDLSPLVDCPNLKRVVVSGRFVNDEPLRARGVQVRRT